GGRCRHDRGLRRRFLHPGTGRHGISAAQDREHLTERDMIKRRGGCLCGAVRYELAGKPRMGAACYCRACPYVAGGAPAHAMVVSRQDISGTGTTTTYWTEAESGRRVAREFCATCGTHLFAYGESKPARVALKVGSLDDPSQFKPQLAIWMASA